MARFGNITGNVSGELTFEDDVTFSGDVSVSGHKEDQILTENTFHIIDADWEVQTDSSVLLDQNKSDKKFIIPVSGLKVGDEITGFRLLGGVGAKAGETSTLDANLRKCTGTAGGISDSSVCNITQVTAEENAILDEEASCTAETVASDYQYYILVTGSTADNAENDIFVTGAEIDVNRK